MTHLLLDSTPHFGPRRPVPAVDPVPAERFLTRAECADLVKRAAAFATGGGSTTVFLESRWEGNVRWARNQITTSGDIRRNQITVQRTVRGAQAEADTNQIGDTHLRTVVTHAERMLEFRAESPEHVYQRTFLEPHLQPKIWSDATFRQSADDRAELMRRVVEPARKAGLLSAGYVQVSAHGRSATDGATLWYYPYTLAQYSVTVRAPDGSGSGWAGVDHTDWTKIDVEHLSQVALEKCLASRNPVRLEPGRYTAILEPQAVADLCAPLFDSVGLDRELAEWGDPHSPQSSDPYREWGRGNPQAPVHVFGRGAGFAKFGTRVIDERLTVRMDPMDPDLGFPPFYQWQVYHPATWIERGVLKELRYSRAYAVNRLHLDTGGLPTAEAFRMSAAGPATGVGMEEMIQTTKRGLLVTRFWGVTDKPNPLTFMMNGYTRDGLWLVENGKISKPVKNFRFTESPVFVLNSVEQIGTPQRVFHPGRDPHLGYAPIIVPALKVRDFSFTSLSDAV